MKKITLNHSASPPDLKEINQEIESILQSEELDDKQFFALVVKRDAIIQSHLDALDEPQKRAFAQAELKVNKQLAEAAKGLLDETRNSISGLIRGRKAIEKYK